MLSSLAREYDRYVSGPRDISMRAAGSEKGKYNSLIYYGGMTAAVALPEPMSNQPSRTTGDMPTSRNGSLVCLTLLLTGGCVLRSAETPPGITRDDVLAGVVAPPGRTPLAILGVFHFGSSSDSYQRQVAFDIRAPDRQREVEQLVEQLERFQPTHVAVEALPEQQRRLDSLFAAYSRGEYTLGPNEIYQIGFRLARRLGHSRVYAVDARMRSYMTYAELKSGLAHRGQDSLLTFQQTEWGARYWRLFQRDDSARARRPLRDHLLYLNSDARLRASMGTNVVGVFRAGDDSTPLGPDWITQSFNRDLRIFRNLLSLRKPGTRILLIVGASHVPTLRLLAEASPELRYVPIQSVLR